MTETANRMVLAYGRACVARSKAKSADWTQSDTDCRAAYWVLAEYIEELEAKND